MKFLIIATLAVSAFTSIAQAGRSNVFHRQETYGHAEYKGVTLPCLYARGSCSVDAIEYDLLELCQRKFSVCKTTFKKKYVTKEGSDVFCGDWYRGKCSVTVVGTNQ
jgi:hypothetical protein